MSLFLNVYGLLLHFLMILIQTYFLGLVGDDNALDKSLRALASNIICFGNLTPSQLETKKNI